MNSTVASPSTCGLGPRAWLPPLLWGLAAGLASAGATVSFVLLKLPAPLRAGIALLPVLLAVGYIACVVRMLRRVDELQRRIQLEALGFAFAATVVVVMAVDLLEQARLVPAVHWGWSGLTVAMALLWGLGNLIAVRRYR